MQQITIATAKSRTTKVWKNTRITWEALGKRLKEVVTTYETGLEYHKMPKSKQADLKDVGGFVGGYLKDGRRKDANVVSRSVISLDADFAPIDFVETLELFNNYEGYVYSTHSHTIEHPRYRLILLLDREVSGEEYGAVSRKIASDIGIDYFDDTTYQASRLMYWASTPKDIKAEFYHLEGEAVKVDEVLARYKDWQDMSEWPESSRSQGLRKSSIEKQGDPLVKNGVVGAFCRTYSIGEAIETFLSEEYIKCNTEGRYTYTRGSTAAGLVVYDDKFAYSNHGTDPASNKLCNAFDLVRLHKFGLKDEDVKEDTPINKLPSYIAMQELVSQDKATKITIGKERFTEAQSEFEVIEEDLDWLSLLDRDKKAQLKQTANNIRIILEHDSRLKNGIIGNDLLAMNKSIKPKSFPWTSHVEVWTDDDLKNLTAYIEKVYGISNKNKISDVVDILFNEKAYHPVRDYLESLEWDGVERLETLFIDFLGAEDTAYNRVITKLHLSAAVSRVTVPGIKYDYMLVFVGPQGIGKSYIIDKLSRGWFTDTISTVSGKEAYESLDGAWLVEMAELTATKKAEVEAVKHFISKREDKFRRAYAKNSTLNKRQCVFFGTTNNHEFLRDTTGNRRMQPIVTGVQKSKFKLSDLDEDYIGQIWAEAKHCWDSGVNLYLAKDLENEALIKQAEHMERDPWYSDIENYVKMLLPLNWAEMDLLSRRDFINKEGFFIEATKGEIARDRVCIREIWTELLGKNWGDINNVYRARIKGVLDSLDCCKRQSTAMRFGGNHGLQKGYIVYTS